MAIYNRQTCCCAIPMYKAGIYTVIAYLAVQGLVLAILSFATPHIIALAVASIGPIIFGILCLAFMAIQIVGFLAAHRDSPGTFKTYSFIQLTIYLLALVMTLVMIIISGVKTSSSVAACQSDFIHDISNNTDNTVASGESTDALQNVGNTECSVFVGIELGAMGLAWVLLGIVNAYFVTLVHHYSQVLSETRGDVAGMTKRYGGKYHDSEAQDNIPLSARPMDTAGAWDSRISLSRPSEDVNSENGSQYRDSHDYHRSSIMGGGVPAGSSSVYNKDLPPPPPSKNGPLPGSTAQERASQAVNNALRAVQDGHEPRYHGHARTATAGSIPDNARY